MTTNGHVVARLDNMPARCTTNPGNTERGTSTIIYSCQDGGEGDEDPSPLASPTPPNFHSSMHRSISSHASYYSSRNRSPSGDSTTSSVGSGQRMMSPLTNIMFLEEFVKEEIGFGFFATVYKVQHRFTGQLMAAKINTRENNWDNVQHEIQLMARISHPNVIRLKGLVIHEGYLHPLLEFINGGTLTSLLTDNQVYLGWPSRISLASDIAAAMAYLHKKGIMHRDLTSSNVLIKRISLDMRAVVCDLGLSCRFPRELSGLKDPVGTPFWMAPECLMHKPYDEKSDVFSFGIILCEVIARITADPDQLPRLLNFGLDEEGYKAIAGTCPEPLLDLVFMCCRMIPFSRPAFVDIEFQLQHIKIKLSRTGRSSSHKDGGGRSRRHTMHLNVPEANYVQASIQQQQQQQQQQSQFKRQPLVRSNSDRRLRDRRLSPRTQQINNANPFDTPALKGGRTKFINSLSTSREQLKQLSPDMSINIREVLCAIFNREDVMSVIDPPVKRRLSVSLPSSPELHRREISLDDESDFLDDLASWPSSSDTFEFASRRTASPSAPDDLRIPSPSFPPGASADISSDKCDVQLDDHVFHTETEALDNSLVSDSNTRLQDDLISSEETSGSSRSSLSGYIIEPSECLNNNNMVNKRGNSCTKSVDNRDGDVQTVTSKFEKITINVEEHNES